jgi:hypothetical protein
MPVRATKRGDERTPLGGSYDVLICGASFAGLAVARELQGSGRRVLMVDRYEVGERQTSACAAPTEWLEALGVQDAILQTFGDLVVHRPRRTVPLEAAVHVLHVRLPPPVRPPARAGLDTVFETAKVHGRTGDTVHTGPRRPDRAAHRRRHGLAARACPAGRRSSRRRRRSRAAWRSTRPATGRTSSCGSTPRTSRRATAGRSRPRARSASAGARSTRASTSRTRRSSSPASSAWSPTSTRATGSRTSCGARRRTGSSSRATPRATACPPPRRASGPPCTSAWSWGASCAPWWTAGAPASRR